MIVEKKQSTAIDGSLLNWKVFAPQLDVKGCVILVPGLTSPNHPKYEPVYNNVAEVLVNLGYECITLSFRGQVGSEGKYSFPNCVEDLEIIISERLESGYNTISLFARSAGCPIALRTAQKKENYINKILLWGGGPRRVYEKLFGPESDGSYMQACIDYGSTMTNDFVSTLFFPEDEIQQVSCPVWLGIGTNDEYSNVGEQQEILLRSKNRNGVLYILPYCRHAISKNDLPWDIYLTMIKL